MGARQMVDHGRARQEGAAGHRVACGGRRDQTRGKTASGRLQLPHSRPAPRRGRGRTPARQAWGPAHPAALARGRRRARGVHKGAAARRLAAEGHVSDAGRVACAAVQRDLRLADQQPVAHVCGERQRRARGRRGRRRRRRACAACEQAEPSSGQCTRPARRLPARAHARELVTFLGHHEQEGAKVRHGRVARQVAQQLRGDRPVGAGGERRRRAQRQRLAAAELRRDREAQLRRAQRVPLRRAPTPEGSAGGARPPGCTGGSSTSHAPLTRARLLDANFVGFSRLQTL